MTKNTWCPDTPPQKIKSPECSVKEKIQKKTVLTSNFAVTKKSWCPDPHPPQLKTSKSWALGKVKIFWKLFELYILHLTKKSCCIGHSLNKSRVQSACVKEKIPKTFFGFKFGMTKKSLCMDPHPPRKIQSPEHSVNEKNSENIIGLKFGMNKKSWWPEPDPLTPQQIQSPDLLGKWNICWKLFWPQIWQ